MFTLHDPDRQLSNDDVVLRRKRLHLRVTAPSAFRTEGRGWTGSADGGATFTAIVKEGKWRLILRASWISDSASHVDGEGNSVSDK